MIGHDILLNEIFYYKLNYIKCAAHAAGLYTMKWFLYGGMCGESAYLDLFVDILPYGYLL